MADTVVYGFFGTKKPEAKAGEPPDEPIVLKDRGGIPDFYELLGHFDCDYDKTLLAKDALYLQKHSHLTESLQQKIDAMQRYLFGVLGMPLGLRTVKLHRNTMRNSAMESLSAMILKSTRKDWDAKRPYYAALAVEYRLRKCFIQQISIS